MVDGCFFSIQVVPAFHFALQNACKAYKVGVLLNCSYGRSTIDYGLNCYNLNLILHLNLFIMKHIFTLLTFLFLTYSLSAQSLMVNTFANAVHSAGAGTASQSATFSFPTDVSAYNQVLMYIDLNCPPGGCDPWDRYANIEIVLASGESIEIGRYITPYGNGDCGWTLDVSDYRELLKGDVTLRSSIETYAGGWSVTLDFEFMEDTQDYAYIDVQNLWYGFDASNNRNYSNYQIGDTLWTSDNLPARTVLIPGSAEQVIFKINNTGHGQGNTLNAAEFRPASHTVRIDGQVVYGQYLWKDDCAQNPCSPQGGNWQPSRAGWCPGQEVASTNVDITSDVMPGQEAVLDYVLAPYLNKCSPLYPTCNPATDCAFGTSITCNYDGQNHTPPHYKMSIQLITKSNNPLNVNQPAQWDDFTVFPNPSTGKYQVNVTFNAPQKAVLNVINVVGEQVFSESFSNRKSLNYELDLTDLSSGIYFLEIQTKEGKAFKKLMLN